jgi:hypothetical protein
MFNFWKKSGYTGFWIFPAWYKNIRDTRVTVRVKESKLVMRSRKLQFFSFINGFNLAYRARLSFYDIPFSNPRIIKFLNAMAHEKLIQAYFLGKKGLATKIRVFFRYSSQQRCLFNKLKLTSNLNTLPERAFTQWLKRKSSLAFPILMLDVADIGILTDRQLFYIRLVNPFVNYKGGKLLAIILP